MAREGITFEQVEQAADTLLGEDKQPTIRAVRELLGSGSPNTIHKHLQTWQAARPTPQAITRELPAKIIDAINIEIEQATASARAEIEGKLVDAQIAANELAMAGESLEARQEELLEQIGTLTTDRDQCKATAEERAAEIERQATERAEEIKRQATEIARERQAAEAARVELAKTQLKIESQEEKLKEQTAELKKVRAAFETERKQCQKAEQTTAVVNTKLEAAQQAQQMAEAREKVALERVAAAEKATQEASQNAHTSKIAEQTAGAKLEAAAREIENVNQARNEAKTAQAEAAELRGRIAAMHDLQHDKPKR